MEASAIPRRALALVLEALEDSRVVLVHGPRQSGKTTVAREVLRRRSGRFETLDDPASLEAALRDPAGFLEGEGLLVLDEFQRAGQPILLAIKAEVDRRPRPGRFLLTGSTMFLSDPALSESLAGRVDIVDLWPLSQGELGGRRERFPDLLLESPEAIRRLRPERLARREVFERVCRGGFPEAVRRSPRSRRRWFDSYVRTVVERDSRELARVRDADDLARLVRLIAARTAGESNAAELARELGVPRTTVADHLPLLRALFLFHEVPAWSRNLTSKVVRSPKVHLTDSGLAARLLGQEPEALLRPVSRAAGPLLETFVAGEIARQAAWSPDRIGLHHFRSREGPEVDLVLESADGRVGAVEVKAARSVASTDFRHLAWLRDRTGDGFVQGVVLHAGESVLPFGDRLTALPVSALWA